MISRRLTKTQKAEILEAYRAGDNSTFLADKYSCTTNTIIRTVKTLLSDGEYKLLKEKRAKINNKREIIIENETVKEEIGDLEYSNSLISLNTKDNNEDLSMELVGEFDNTEVEGIASLVIEHDDSLSSINQDQENNEVEENDQNIDNNFELIAPIISCFDFDQEKEKSNFKIHDYKILPESVYMIVDKKVELEPQNISDLPEWSFLPETELERRAILLFTNQRAAKRNCSKNQKVIKIPNTSIFRISKSYLLSKGITRLILEDLLISLDN